jgi:glutamyl-tRNA reductase
MDICLVGLNHRTAPLEIRERLAVAAADVPVVLPDLCERSQGDEALLISTCNRTEILGVSRLNGRIEGARTLAALCALRGGAEAPGPDCVYELHGAEAVRHVMRVAAGLDSMLLGEPQILGQLRQAFALATESGTSGLHISKVFHSAFRVGKRVRSETELGYGAVSVAYVAVALARKVFGEFGKHTALVIGAGEMAESAAKHLRDGGIGRLIFVNRTESKAVALAMDLDGESMEFARLGDAFEQADIVISSTGAPGFILTHEVFHEVMDKRHTRPVFLVDIAVPRDIDPEINDHDNAFLYDVDSLQQVADGNLERRRAAIPDAEALVEKELVSYFRWRERLKVEPVIKLLHEKIDAICRCEVERSRKRFSKSDVGNIEKMLASMQKKILHQPSRVLRRYDPETEEGMRAIEIVRQLFDLDG